MVDEAKTKAELIAELKEMRQRVADLEKNTTELGQIDKEFQGNEKRFRSLLANSPEGIALFEHKRVPLDLSVKEQINLIVQSAVVTECNDTFAQGMGATQASEVIGKRYFPDIRAATPELLKMIETFLLGGYRLIDLETNFVLPDGSEKYFLNSTYGVIESGSLVRSWVIRRDITILKEVEEELKANEENYQSLLKHSAEGIARFEHDPGIPVNLPVAEQVDLICRTARVADCNNVFARGVGAEKAGEIIGKLYIPEIVPAIPEITAIVEKFVTGGHRLVAQENTNVLPDGSKVYFLNDTYGIIESGRLVRSWVVNRDITQIMEVEEALRKSEMKFRSYFEGSSQGIFVHRISDKGPEKAIEANEAILNMLGYTREEFLELNLMDHIEPEEQARAPERIREMMQKGSIVFELNIITKDGRKIPSIMHVNVIDMHDKKLVIASVDDITERKRAEAKNAELEKQLQRAQRLETVGRLAGNIAHDFNNILTPIICYLESAQEKLSPGDPLNEDIQDIFTGTTRAQELVAQILTFSRQLEPERQSLNVPAIIKEAVKLLRPVITPSVKIQHRIHGSCQNIWADPSQIHQVIFNLGTNAYQALEGKKGTITIELKQVHIDAGTAGLHSNFEEREYIRLTVSDTGVGMDNDTRNRIFEPYFTTKEMDKGTGLGLSVVYGIVRQNDGEIIVISEPSQGSTFHVYLPVTASEERPVQKKAQLIEGGGESILIVDDEKPITRALTKLLTRLGYDVDGKNGCTEALEAFHNKIYNYDLVITDLTMPDMSGLEFAQELQKICPGLPIILTTGFEKNITGDIRKDFGIREIIQKPLSRQKIASAIRRVLDT